MNTPWGELSIDSEGNAHFQCHTPGNATFEDVRIALTKFIALLQGQIDREDECPVKHLRVMEFEYGRGVTGDSVRSMRRMADVLANDLRSINAKWRIDDMTVPEWQIVDGNVEVKFRYDSKRYSEQLRITA